jgi:hypothetical protein
MHGVAGFLDSFIQDEVKCRCLDEDDFGAPIDNAENDVPLYDMYNRGLTACQQGLERNPLNLEGQRPGMTGYIPSMEEALEEYPASSPKPKALVLSLGAPSREMVEESKKRRGLIR